MSNYSPFGAPYGYPQSWPPSKPPVPSPFPPFQPEGGPYGAPTSGYNVGSFHQNSTLPGLGGLGPSPTGALARPFPVANYPPPPFPSYPVPPPVAFPHVPTPGVRQAVALAPSSSQSAGNSRSLLEPPVPTLRPDPDREEGEVSDMEAERSLPSKQSTEESLVKQPDNAPYSRAPQDNARSQQVRAEDAEPTATTTQGDVNPMSQSGHRDSTRDSGSRKDSPYLSSVCIMLIFT